MVSIGGGGVWNACAIICNLSFAAHRHTRLRDAMSNQSEGRRNSLDALASVDIRGMIKSKLNEYPLHQLDPDSRDTYLFDCSTVRK